MVNVSSFSVVIRLPNHDFFVSSGEESGVRCTFVEQSEARLISILCFLRFVEKGEKSREPTSSALVSNLRRWNRGLPRNEFLMVVNLDRQWWALDPAPVCGEPGGVTPTATTAKRTILYLYHRVSFAFRNERQVTTSGHDLRHDDNKLFCRTEGKRV